MLIISSLLFGLILGQFFRWFVLLPAGVITLILLAADLADAGHYSVLSSFLQFGAVNVSLQVGYVVGVIILFSIRALSASAHSPTAPADNSEAFSMATDMGFAARTGAPSLGSATLSDLQLDDRQGCEARSLNVLNVT